MFARKAYDQLLAWKRESAGSSAMLIEGARRVGKSTLAEEFARNEYASYLLVDFTRVAPGFRQTFLDTRNNLDEFFLNLTAAYGTRLIPGNSLVIFDEVQLFPEAREFIKHLVADGRYHYLETGSLISIKKNVENIVIPSEEDSMDLWPMDFDEFLWALGEDAMSELIRRSFELRRPLTDDLHRKAMRLWREYLLVGGMPQAVSAYISGRDLAAADAAKRRVLKIYRDDIATYGGGDTDWIKAVFDSIPAQLSKHEKKLVFTEVEPGSRSRSYEGAFAWMREARIANLCQRCTDPSVALALSADPATVKCYMGDTGLLVSQAFSAGGRSLSDVYRQTLAGDLSLNEGMLAENAVAQQLVAAEHPLYFYSDSSKVREDRMEIDFLAVEPYDNAAGKPRVTPIEVKSGTRYKTVSLGKFKDKFGSHVGMQVVLHPRQLKADGDMIFLPLYMAGCL